jgi:voltage-gated potassium channel
VTAPSTVDPLEAVPADVDPRLATWERRMNPVIIAAAIAPIAVGLTQGKEADPATWLNLISWLVFLVDLLVHLRWRPGYIHTKLGRFDLAIVVLTAPWFFIPGFSNANILGVARLSRLARVFIVSTKSPMLRNLGRRLGQAALYGFVLMVCCAIVVMSVEPESSGFADFGDSMWWAIVTFTTVGYGDLVPVTHSGRAAAVLLMLGGIALIGTLAGSLGSFFAGDDPEGAEDPPSDPDVAALLDEVRLLRAELAEVRSQLPGATTDD